MWLSIWRFLRTVLHSLQLWAVPKPQNVLKPPVSPTTNNAGAERIYGPEDLPKWGSSLPAFSATTAASKIPVEIWDDIIDRLWDDPKSLRACEVVCKAWRPRSEFLIERGGAMIPPLTEQRAVYYFSRFMRAVPKYRQKVTRISIIGGGAPEEGKEKPLVHLGSFAAMLAGFDFPRLEVLTIMQGAWSTGALSDDVYLHLSSFTTITHLSLDFITLPSMTVFGRLVCALPGLEELGLQEILFANPSFPKGRRFAAPPSFRRAEVRVGPHPPHALLALVATKLVKRCRDLELSSLPSDSLEGQAIQQLLYAAGTTVRRLRVDMSPLRQPGGPGIDPDIVERHMNLSFNTKLQELEIDVELNRHATHSANTDSVLMFLSRSPARNLQKVTLTFGNPSRDFVLDRSDLLSLCREFFRLDQLLTEKQFRALKAVVFSYNTRDYPGVGLRAQPLAELQAIWRTELAPDYFPRLLAQGILELNVSDGLSFKQIS